ncbi:hypothetical protein L486_03691 [Kwoniella mangroviensis CBS 10435]|uniref:Uncharacterized protein n=1 Tax=Kwoniella mangroviensis CBS 10435 TaxID=1331196 RepID=A0A1B9IUH5_9TREE|nr:hypothetical protein L486_03691 [Kwoniella mangroviensis CBS 10435]
MSTLAYSPSSSSSSILSYRPTSPLSRPCSPLSDASGSHSYSRSTSPHYQHTSKAKSVSSIPTYHSIHRLTQTPMPFDQAGPSNSNISTISRSSSFKHRPNPRSQSPNHKEQQKSGLSRSSSVRSCRSKKFVSETQTQTLPQSPSRLPSIDCVSYFPPFEDMGSTSSFDGAETARDHRLHSRLERISSQHSLHKKGKSLSSIAGIMSASLSWSLSGLACTSPSSTSTSPKHQNIDGNDDKVVEALTKRFSSSSSTSSKRRVLEPFTLTPLDLDTTNRHDGEDRSKMHKRRMRSEIEVDLSLIRSNSLKEKLHLRGDSLKGDRVSINDEDLVDSMLGNTPSRPSAQSTRRTRPNLRLPIPTLPNWRFPLGPSPPVTCLSPDIPLEAFSTAIDNPCLLTPSRTTFSQSHSPSTGEEEEVEVIDCGLSVSASPSPTSPCSFGNGPSTPPKDHNGTDNVSIHNNSLSPWSNSKETKSNIDLDLRRIESRTSELSIETIKIKQPSNGWLDVTPKSSKIVKRDN